MRYSALSSILLGTAISTMTFAAQTTSTESLNYNIANVQADATRQVSNDEMHAVLYIEKSNRQPAELAAQISQLMNQAIATSSKYPKVKVETGAQSTYPVYDNDNRKLKEWRGRAEVRIESKDFKAASQLISELQQNFQTQSINFTVSDEQRKKVENELIVEASKNFQQRSQLLTQAWNKSSYQLVSLNINTNSSSPQPIMMRSSMAKFATAEMAPAQDVAAGESSITVTANGSIQFK
ncbi:SIMPL domain-containing protein [Acinetobacter sp. WZC-1]|uniref:SIMPL domain-containing protein n=1 Tax=Acinetobacter sp. WZC-1 TaxID=3459034 RepID=UPI00403D8C0C